MKSRCLVLLGLFLLWKSSSAMACTTPISVCTKDQGRGFGLIRQGKPADIYVDSGSDPAVIHAAQSFAEDLGRVSGHTARLVPTLKSAPKEVVIIGVLGHSPLIDRLIRTHRLKRTALTDHWEAYQQIVIDHPAPGIRRALIIAGSDRRGAVFGTYDLSEKMGISPWYWWADVPVRKARTLYISPGSHEDAPKVRYRGLFINDEDPALKGWATKAFGGVNAKMYAHVFELILRLKGNYLWPAMWGKAFNVDDPDNMRLADEMGVVMGTSHHEPMMRAQQEWHIKTTDGLRGGKWDYLSNGENLRAFWRGGIERMVSKPGGGRYDSLVTIGMRGDGDEPMSEGTATALLEGIVTDQRRIIAEVTGRPAAETPQVWALYKEVQSYYEHGMKVPDDVTLLFSDDNWGQLRRLPIAGKDNLSRAGGYGIYYHFDYVGGPRNYKWINTNQGQKIWQQLDLAYQRGARSLWIFNVGDIKPMEYPISLAMKMAWDPPAMTPQALEGFPKVWASQNFGPQEGPAIGDILSRYGELVSRRKPELLSQDSYSTAEFDRLNATWQALRDQMAAIKARLKPEALDAYMQLVEYPVEAVANLYDLYDAAAWNHVLASRQDPRANSYADRTEADFRRDGELTRDYHRLKDGKWDGMMNQVHMSYVSWNDPPAQTLPALGRVSASRDTLEPVAALPSADPAWVLDIPASHFQRALGGKDFRWTILKGLAHPGDAVIALPQGRAATTPKDRVRLEYDVQIPQAGEGTLTLILAPTLDTSLAGGVHVGLSVDDGPVVILNENLIPTPGGVRNTEERNWVRAVSDNEVRLEMPLGQLSAGPHRITVWRLDDNIVLQGLHLERAKIVSSTMH